MNRGGGLFLGISATIGVGAGPTLTTSDDTADTGAGFLYGAFAVNGQEVDENAPAFQNTTQDGVGSPQAYIGVGSTLPLPDAFAQPNLSRKVFCPK